MSGNRPQKPATQLVHAGRRSSEYHGVVNPPRMPRIFEWKYEDRHVVLKKGEEMGRFLLGSTVVMLFRRGSIAFNADWSPERAVRLGESMGDRPRA